jgi:N-acetyl-alpha-D-muramate 1-phosphate uridylyltransferase
LQIADGFTAREEYTLLPIAILAGGLGTRLRPLTETTPKALLPIRGEPFIAHQLRLLRSRGIDRVVLCVGYLGEQVHDFVGAGDAFGLAIDYSWDGSIPLGTASALRRALPKLGDAFFVIYGDSYLPCNYRAAQDTFLRSGKQALITVFRNDGHWDASNLEFCGGRIVAYDKHHRTPRMRYIDYGLGAFHSSAFDALSDAPCDLATVYQDLLSRDELAALEVHERFYEAGSLEGIRSLSDLLAGTIR